MRHLILTACKYRKSGQHSVPRWIYLGTIIPTLTIIGMRSIAVYYKYKKNKCKKTYAKIYGLARNRGKTTEILGTMLCHFVLGTEMMSIWKMIIPHKEDSDVLTGVKQRQDHEVEAKSVLPVLRLAPSVTTQI